MNLIFLGPPGAGKGTIAAKVRDHYHIPHISTGDLFRAHIQNKTPIGTKVKALMDEGELVPDELTIEMVKQRLKDGDTDKGYILDGFPRTINQAEHLEQFADISGVLDFEVCKEVIVKRLSGRRIAKQSGRVYHIEFNPPKTPGRCDETGEALIQRADDKPEAVRHRLEVYEEQTAPLIKFYKEKNLLIPIDGEKPVDEVFAEVRNLLSKLK